MDRATYESAPAGETLVRSPVRLPLPELPEERHGVAVLTRFGFTETEADALVRAGVLHDPR